MSVLTPVLLAGCALPPVDLERVGLAPRDILSLEIEGWKYNMRPQGLSPEFQPIAVRDLRCVRPRHSFKNHYSCDYLLDYGTTGSVAGTLGRKDMTVGREPDGSWQHSILVTGS